jgi:hypothetical protein
MTQTSLVAHIADLDAVFMSPNRLPFGMQMEAQPYAEDRFLVVVPWCERVLVFTARPVIP